MAARNSHSSLNMRLRNICEREGMDYGEDATDEDDLVRRFRVATQLTSKGIGKIMSDIKKAKTVDLCFLIDGTASMKPHIDGVRDSVNKIVNTLLRSQQSPSGIEQLRLAVVVYRDFDSSIPLEVFKFSDRSEECITFCKDVKATSGARCDTPEDVFGGLEEATRLDWSDDAGSRIIFHMGDAPCHGNRYHDSRIPDNYPAGDPKGRTSEGLFKRIRELNIDYYFGKINRYTDQMIDQFCKDYGRFIKTFGVEDIGNIAGSVIASVSASVEANVEKSKLDLPKQAKQREFRLELAVPDWDQMPVQQGTYFLYSLPDSIEDVVDDKPLDEKRVSNVRVMLAQNPFAEGSERIAYYGRDLFEGYGEGGVRGRSATRRDRRAVSAPRWPPILAESPSGGGGPTDIVLKEYKFLGKKQNTLERYKTACEAQTIAFYLADQFNELTREAGVGPIKFLKTKTLMLTSPAGLRIMSCERKFQGAIKFVKFTNNCTYSMQSAADEVSKCGIDAAILDTVMAFSHWTYQRTNGFLMVVDLQGCICSDAVKPGNSKAASKTSKLLMTDPAIHCLDVTRYNPLNLGKHGMRAFFEGHRGCNRLCRKLGLTVVDKV